MKAEKLLKILYGIILTLFCVLFFLFSNFIISFKLLLAVILILIPLGISYILSRLFKAQFIVVLNLTNNVVIFLLFCLTIVAVGNAIQESKLDAQEANLDFSKDPQLYIRAIRKKASKYLYKKYANADVTEIGSYTFPLKDSNYSVQKPDIIHDMAVYLNGNKKENMRLIRLEFDSSLNYSVIYDRKSDEDSALILKRISDSLEKLTP
jgi:hypothetical protein